ncbi:MAG TPA: fibronectin type III domain-containing protein, partial [Pseudomonadales bacterium]
NAVVPGAPTIGSATASNTQATVAFTAPASNGGSAITSYTVTSSPGNISATGAGSPITVTGLTNGVAYTFTAKAENSAGTGSASAASNSVTPKASNTITFSNPGAQNFGTTPVLTATATSTDTVTFSSATTGVCTITSSGALTFVTAGTCTIRADEDGTASYLAATQVSQSFTVNAVVPGAPTIGTATAGDTLATVSFTAPASNGGVAITGYTVTSTPGHITANGTSSPITVAGLTNGTAYTFTVTATNSIGTGSASAASNSVAPAAPPPSPPESNPFNPGGTQTQTNLDPAIGVVPTRAPNDIVTNIGNLDNRVGISDNGVVVVLDNGLREPVKFRDNPPDNVLISMTSRKPLVVQLGGNTLNIHVDPETPNPPTQTILGTTTLQLPGGTSANGLQLVQGEVTIGNDAPGAPIGGMDLSKDTTLRSLVAQSGQDGGTAGFRKGLDGAGSVSAESGEVRITVRLKNTGISTLSQAIALPGFTAPPARAAATDTLTLTLQAGEVARFDALGELDGVFLGSLSGKMGKTGDTLAMTAPAGVAGYPASTLVFDGGNVPARIGMAFSDFMNAQLDDQLHFSQRADGVMQVKSSGGGEFYARTIRGFEVVEGAADGASANGDGSLSLTYGGIRSTWQPMLEDAADLSAYAAALGAYVTDVLENGNVQLSGATTHFFVARPRHALRNVFGRTQGIAPVAPGDSSLFYTNARGAQQQLDPAFHDEAQLRIAAAAQGWTLTRSGLGGNNLTASSPDGVVYQVVPDFRVDVLGADTGLRGVIRQEGSKLYFYYADEPLRQGFTLRAR